jgi:hypothetical protein
MHITPVTRAAVAVLLAHALVSFANGKPIASDNFDSYTPGASIVGGKGGDGLWRSAWSGQASFVTITNAPEDAVSLTLDNGETRGGGNALKITGPADGGQNLSVIGRRIPGMKGDDLFVSFVFKIKNDDPGGTNGDGKQITGMNLVQLFAEDDTHETMRDIAAFVGWNGKVGARLSQISDGNTLQGRLVAGQAYFIVIKYTGWNASKDGRYQWCRVWLNPSVNDQNTQKPTITYARIGKTAGYGSKGIRGLYVNTLGLNSGGKYHLIDDIRLGTTWNDVVDHQKNKPLHRNSKSNQ